MFSPSSAAGVSSDARVEQTFLTQVFAWMFVGLALTAGVAAYFASQSNMTAYFDEHPFVMIGLIVAELALVVVLVAAIERMSAAMATFAFCFYAGLSGVTFSILLEVYTAASIAGAFVTTAGMFGAMAAYGYFTRRDLTAMGSFLLMALVGLLIGLVVNLLWANSVLYWVLTFAGVLIFCALTAYDVNKLRQIGAYAMDEDTARKQAIRGALALYLDFVNLFIMMLRVFGRS